MENADTQFNQWLNEGQNWVGRLTKVGLASCGKELLNQGRNWQQQCLSMGWQQLNGHLACCLDEDCALELRAQALLNLAACLATARNLVEAEN